MRPVAVINRPDALMPCGIPPRPCVCVLWLYVLAYWKPTPHTTKQPSARERARKSESVRTKSIYLACVVCVYVPMWIFTHVFMYCCAQRMRHRNVLFLFSRFERAQFYWFPRRLSTLHAHAIFVCVLYVCTLLRARVCAFDDIVSTTPRLSGQLFVCF